MGIGFMAAGLSAVSLLPVSVMAEPEGSEYDYAAEQAAWEEMSRLAEEQAAWEEASRQAEEQAAWEEASRQAEEQAAWEEASRQAEEQAAAEEASRQAAEAAAAEEASRLAEEQAAAEEASRLAEEAAAEAARQAAEEASRQAEEEERIRREQEQATTQETTTHQPETQTTTQAETTTGTMTVSIASAVPRYVVLNVPFELKLQITGGSAPYSIQAGDNAAAATAAAEGEIAFPVTMATVGKDRKLDIRVTDAGGTAAVLQYDLPVTGTAVANWDTINAAMAQIQLQLKEHWGENLLIIARTQLGASESSENFVIDERGRFFGYSQYGLWQANHYGEWSPGFVEFCLHYAKIYEHMFPYAASAAMWPQLLGSLFKAPGTDYEPKAGDIVLLHVTDPRLEETPFTQINHAGLITSVTEDAITTIEGNVGGSVKECRYMKDANGAFVDAPRGAIILGYADMEQAEQTYLSKVADSGEDAEEEEETDETADGEETDEELSEEDGEETGGEEKEEDKDPAQAGEDINEEDINIEETEKESEESDKQDADKEEEDKEDTDKEDKDKEETEEEEADFPAEYIVEAEGMVYTITPENPEALPKGTVVRIEFFDEQETQTRAEELLEPLAGENEKIEVRQARSLRIIFEDKDGNEFQPMTALKVSVSVQEPAAAEAEAAAVAAAAAEAEAVAAAAAEAAAAAQE